MATLLKARARAKLNLFLRIERKRPDGRHDLSTLFHSVELGDLLGARVRPGASSNSPAALAMAPSPFSEAAGPPEGNLVLRADALMRSRWPALPAVEWELEKLVPAGAGLGGGSADAAAALVLLNEIGGLGLPGEELERLGSELGADVAFCVRGGCALGRGAGDELEFLPSRLRSETVVAWPGVPISTAEAYAACRPEGPAPPELLDALRRFAAEENPSGPSPLLSNSFYSPALPNYTHVRRVAELLRRGGAARPCLSGSGSAVFALFESPLEAERCALAAAEDKAAWSARTRLAPRGVEIL